MIRLTCEKILFSAVVLFFVHDWDKSSHPNRFATYPKLILVGSCAAVCRFPCFCGRVNQLHCLYHQRNLYQTTSQNMCSACIE